jgi:hypothetical protein
VTEIRLGKLLMDGRMDRDLNELDVLAVTGRLAKVQNPVKPSACGWRNERVSLAIGVIEELKWGVGKPTKKKDDVGRL